MKQLIIFLTLTLSMLFTTTIMAQSPQAKAKAKAKLTFETQKPDRYIVYYQKNDVAKVQTCKTKAEIIIFLNGYSNSTLSNPDAKNISAKIKPDQLKYIFDLKTKENIDFVEFTVQHKVRKKKIEKKTWKLEQWKKINTG